MQVIIDFEEQVSKKTGAVYLIPTNCTKVVDKWDNVIPTFESDDGRMIAIKNFKQKVYFAEV